MYMWLVKMCNMHFNLVIKNQSNAKMYKPSKLYLINLMHIKIKELLKLGFLEHVDNVG